MQLKDLSQKFMFIKPALFDSLKGYSFKKLTADLMSGLLVAIIALPLSIALGIQSGVTLQQGIITAIVAGFIISLFGGSKVQIGGPTAAFVVIVLGYVNNPEIGLIGLQFATVMAGIILLFLGLFRAGKLVRYIPYPIILGFTAGIGVTLMVGQIKGFFGIDCLTGGHFISQISILFQNIKSISFATTAIGCVTIAIIICLPKINAKFPSAFVAVITATLLTLLVNKFYPHSVDTIGSSFGEIKAQFYFPQWANLGSLNIVKLIVPSMVIAFLGAIESLLSATVADSMINGRHDSNTELFAQGLTNIASACFGGLPATGAIARTAANVKNGGRSPVAGMFHAVILLIMFLVLMPIMKFIPMASLSAVLIMVALGMANFKLCFKMILFNWRDTAILLTTFVLTVTEDLVFGVGGGFLVACILQIIELCAKTNISQAETLEKYTHLNANLNNAQAFLVTPHLTFKSADKLISHIDTRIENYDTIIFDLSLLKTFDLSAMEKLVKYFKRLNNSGVSAIMVLENPRQIEMWANAQKYIGGSKG